MRKVSKNGYLAQAAIQVFNHHLEPLECVGYLVFVVFTHSV